jgi:hypothetical protein
MPPSLLMQPGALAALMRSVFINTVAGLITALLLSYWTPAVRLVPQPRESTDLALADSPAPLNVDPISGKLLDRIEGAGEVARPAPTPILTYYGVGVESAPDALAQTPPVQLRSTPAKASRTAAPKAKDAVQKLPQAAHPAALESTEPPPPTNSEEGESWMSKFSPAGLTARVAPFGRDLASGLAAKAGGAVRALADKLGAFGF